MTEDDIKKLTNALAFLYSLIAEDCGSFLKVNFKLPHPDYILGKYYRYCEDASEYEYMWGLHPGIYPAIKQYLREHDLPFLAPPEWVKEAE